MPDIAHTPKATTRAMLVHTSKYNDRIGNSDSSRYLVVTVALENRYEVSSS